MNGDLLLGLDVGTSRTKALLLNGSGAEVALTAVPTPFTVFEDGRIEMQVGDLLGSVSAAIQGLGQGLGPQLGQVAAVGIAGMAECGAPLDASGAPMAPVVAWNDPRGAEVAERLIQRFGEAVAIWTGQLPRPVSSVAKLGWLVANGWAGVSRWLGVPELILWHLTGGQATEHSLASRTGCYDIARQQWLEDVAAVAGFHASVFAEVMAAGNPMGKVTPEAAADLGLAAGIPVTLAGHDHLAGAAGVGAGPGDLVNSVGTAETVVGGVEHLPDLRQALALPARVSVAPGGGGWVILASAARAGMVLSAAAQQLGGSFEELDALAEAAPSVVGAPDRAVLDSLAAGQPGDLHSQPPGVFWRGLLEALSARTAEAAAKVGTLAPAERLLVIGGGAASRPWMQAKARVIPLPVLRPHTGQAAARGAAVFAGQAAGWWASPAEAPPPEASEVVP